MTSEDNKRYQREYHREYRKRPEVKKKLKDYYLINKVRIDEYHKEYRKRLEVKENSKIYQQEYCKRKDVIEKRKNIYLSNKDFIFSLKDGKVCLDCGYDDARALEWHHIDPSTKSFSISRCGGRSKESILEEINKCYLICANCHRIRHYCNE